MKVIDYLCLHDFHTAIVMGLYLGLLNMFMSNEYVEKTDVTQIDPRDGSHWKPLKDIIIDKHSEL